MKDHHHIAKYNVEFNEYAALTSFNNHALYAKYYKGLAPRIKDSLVFAGRPTNIDGLCLEAQYLNLRYWEQRDEDRSSAPSNGGSSSKSSGMKSTGGNASASTPQSYRSNTIQSKPTSRASTPSASSSASLSKPKKTDLSSILGPDGKLLPEEKECRCKIDLCMICGSKNHFADKCPSNKDKMRGRSAHLEELVREPNIEGSASEDKSMELPN